MDSFRVPFCWWFSRYGCILLFIFMFLYVGSLFVVYFCGLCLCSFIWVVSFLWIALVFLFLCPFMLVFILVY